MDSRKPQDQLQILVIEDNPGDARLLTEALVHTTQVNFVLTNIPRLNDGLALLEQRQYDMVILDLNLPDSFGFDTFEKLHKNFPNIPVVVLSGESTEDLAVKTVDAGAQDYIFKDSLTNHSLVVRTLRYAHGRAKVQRQLKAAESRLRTVIESTSDGIIVIDLQGKIRFANSAAESILALFPTGELAREEFPFPIKTEEDVEVSVKRPDGKVSTLAISTTQTQWDEEPAYCASVRDISEIVEARHTAERAARLKSEFLANMSHEIRTPLNGVIGMTSLLRDTILNHDQKEYVEAIRSSGEVLLTLINDILDLSKIEAGKVVLEKTSFNLSTIIDETLDLFVEQIRSKKLNVFFLMPPSLPEAVQGDPWRLRQVLSNLIGNAVKFTESGEIVVRTRVKYRSNSKAHIRIEICDTGIGIQKSKVKNLFQVFTQADTSTTRRFGGTGLGLAISKRLVELMGGKIGVTSHEGKGSTFWVSLRLEVLTKGESQRLPLETFKDKQVGLLIPDALTRARIKEMLEAWSIRVSELGSLAEGAWDHLDAIIDQTMNPLAGARNVVSLAPVGVPLDSASPSDAGRLLRPPIQSSDILQKLADAWSGKESQASEAMSPVSGLLELKGKARGASPLILVAEDNLVNQKIIAKMLQSLGYRVNLVSNGSQAVIEADNPEVSLCLMDCQMPEMDGFEATRRMRGSPHFPGYPIIAMTAYALAGDKERCLQAGMNDYLPKPIRLEDLSTMLKAWLASAAAKQKLKKTLKTDGASALDPSILESYRALDAGESGFLSEIIEIFLESTPPLIKEMREAARLENGNLVRHLAHRLKGSAAHLGAQKLSQVSSSIEEAFLSNAGGPGISQLRGKLDEVEDAYEAAEVELRSHWLSGGAPPSSAKTLQ